MKTEFTITITLRPLRWLRNMAAVAVAIGISIAPFSRLSPHAANIAPTVEQLSIQTAVGVVEDILTQRSKLPPAQRLELARFIVQESVANGFDPLFIMAIIETESNFDPRARSIRCREPGNESTCYLNASGLMQVIPRTWDMEVRRRGLGKLDPLDGRHNVLVGVGYLGHLAKGFKRTTSLLWAYNQGPGVASGKFPADWDLERIDKAKTEGANFENKVMTTYSRLLAKYCGIKPTWKRAQTLYRAPSLTILTPAIQRGDIYGPPELPRKVP
jgi:soluble lytic murein transglycosylase-like protein